ncbi:MAG: hypothetical protein ACXABY_01080 [Candidatus Thorarchaeota archaeon]|jgi:hypothetical protein
MGLQNYLNKNFAALRRRKPHGNAAWEEIVNTYQQELGGMWTEFVSDLASEVYAFEDPDIQIQIAYSLIDEFADELTAISRESIYDASAEGLKQVAPAGVLLSVAGSRMARNEEFIYDSLTPGIKQRISEFFSDPANIITAGALILLLAPMQARVESYAGQAWAAINQATGEYARVINSPVYWARDGRAEHCETCIAFGEREYDSFDDLLAITGGILPADGTACHGNCRCSLLVQEDGGWTRP